ncbi:MAG: hypothetical protein RRY76_02755 [Clostridia bacterium]
MNRLKIVSIVISAALVLFFAFGLIKTVTIESSKGTLTDNELFELYEFSRSNIFYENNPNNEYGFIKYTGKKVYYGEISSYLSSRAYFKNVKNDDFTQLKNKDVTCIIAKKAFAIAQEYFLRLQHKFKDINGKKYTFSSEESAFVWVSQDGEPTVYFRVFIESNDSITKDYYRYIPVPASECGLYS